MNNFLPFLDPYNTVGMGIDLLTGKPKSLPPVPPAQQARGSSTAYKGFNAPADIPVSPPVEDEDEGGLMADDAIVDSGPMPGDPDYQPPGTVDGTPARPINDGELPAPDTSGKMPQIEQSGAPDAYAPDSDVAESSLDLSSPTWGKFMSNPGSSDALLAFGAAMLGAPNFNAGLGAAGQAFGQALKPYEKMSEAEKERLLFQAKLKTKIARESGSGSSSKWRNIGIIQNADGTQSSVRFNDETNEQIEVPMKGIRAQDSPSVAEGRQEGILAGKARDVDFERVNEADNRIRSFDRVLELIDTAGVGSDWYTQIARKMALGTGFDFGGVNVTDASELDTHMAIIELDASEAIKGQGQVTEFERKIIRASKGEIKSNPEALKKIMGILKKSVIREKDMALSYDKWNADKANTNKTYFDFKREWKTRHGYISAETVNSDGSSGVSSETQNALDMYK